MSTDSEIRDAKTSASFIVAGGHDWISERVFSTEYGVPAKTLQHWRGTGEGPKFSKCGRKVLYRRKWIDDWLEGRAVTSTAEARRSGLI